MIDLARVLITGAEGMIGSAIPWGIKTDLLSLDVTRSEHIEKAIRKHQPQAILHLAALDIHAAALQPFQAYRVNVFGTYYCVTAAAKHSLPLILLSSGAVFNGYRRQIHDEDAQPDPVNIFAQTKYLSEILVRSLTPKSLIVRTGWIFGGHQADHKKFVDQAIEQAHRDEPIRAANDQWGSPTSVVDLVSALGEMIEQERTGLLHVVNGGAATAFDMAQEIIAVLASSSALRPISAKDTVASILRRPASEALSSRYMQLRPWQAALRDYVLKRV